MVLKQCFLLVVLGATLISCAGPGKLSTPSGKAEVTVSGLRPAEVVAGLRAWAPTKGEAVTDAAGMTVSTMSSVEVPTAIWMKQSVGARTVYNVTSNENGSTVHALRFIGATRNYDGYYLPLQGATVLTNEYNSQEGLEQLQSELEDLKTYLEHKGLSN